MFYKVNDSIIEGFKRCVSMLLAMVTVIGFLCMPGTLASAQAATSNVTIPSPGGYFGGVDRTDRGCQCTVYYCEGHKSYPENAMKSYVKALKSAGLTGGSVNQDTNGDMLAILEWNGQWAVSVRWYKNDQYVWVNVSDRISVSDSATKPVVTPAVTVTGKTSIMKLIEDTFGKSYTKDSADNGYDALLRFKFSSYPAADMKLFAKHLKALGLKEVEKYVHSDGEICMEYQWNGKKVVKIWYDVKKQKTNNVFTVGVYWDTLKETKVFDEKDVPNRTPVTPGTGGFSNCISCGGSGRCSDCGGSGVKRKWVSGTVRSYVTQNCTSCYSPGKCRNCGGDGKK